MKNSYGNSKSLVAKTVRGEPCDRVPTGQLAVHFCASRLGVSIRDYTTNPKILAESVIRYYEEFRPDAVWISADTWVTAEAMGAPVCFTDSNQPMGSTGQPAIRTRSDIDRIASPDVNRQGRYPIMLEAFARVVEAIGSEAFIVPCFDQYPFSLACALIGMDKAMLMVHFDPEMLCALMERCVEYSVAYASAFAAAGADLLSGGDSPAGLIGPTSYKQIAQPYEVKVVAELRRRTEMPISLHICGNATPLLDDMADTGVDVLELDHFVSLDKAIELVGDRVAIWGNVDPVGVLVNKSEEDVETVCRELINTAERAGYRRFILSSGCTLAVDTPDGNLRAMLRAARSSELDCMH